MKLSQTIEKLYKANVKWSIVDNKLFSYEGITIKLESINAVRMRGSYFQSLLFLIVLIFSAYCAYLSYLDSELVTGILKFFVLMILGGAFIILFTNACLIIFTSSGRHKIGMRFNQADAAQKSLSSYIQTGKAETPESINLLPD